MRRYISYSSVFFVLTALFTVCRRFCFVFVWDQFLQFCQFIMRCRSPDGALVTDFSLCSLNSHNFYNSVTSLIHGPETAHSSTTLHSCSQSIICTNRNKARNIQGGPKIGTLSVRLITSSNNDQCSNFFHCQNQNKICNSTVTKDTTTPQMCRNTTLWNVKVLKQQLKKDFCNNTFQEINNRKQRVYCLSYCLK